jgi:hypothetical protein
MRTAIRIAQTVTLTCDNCGKCFERKKTIHKNNLRRGRTKTYCSPECSGKVTRTKPKYNTDTNRISSARSAYKEVCSLCNEQAVRTLESRITSLGHRRRRKVCDSCGSRHTTYEVPAEFYKSKDSLICTSCKFSVGNQCSFGLPEYMTIDAGDCNMHQEP